VVDLTELVLVRHAEAVINLSPVLDATSSAASGRRLGRHLVSVAA
jgi:hypothetical protein